MYYKVKHKETGLYYQPTTSSGSNLSKNGKIYATTSSCLSGNEDYIGITIKKESVVYKKYINILSEKYVDEACACNKHRYVFYKIPKTDFEKEYIK